MRSSYIHGGCPSSTTIIQDNRHNRWEFTGWRELSTADQAFIEQAHIGLNADCHISVDRGLKFKEYIDIKPALLPPYPPEYVIFTLMQIGANVTAVHPLQGGEIDGTYPVGGDKTP
jgi:hypothetical protein